MNNPATTADVLRAWLPIGISLLSLTLACIALGWNVYRDVVLKARVRVRFQIVTEVTPGVSVGPKYLKISVTNHGPGPVLIDIIEGKHARLLHRAQYFVILTYLQAMSPKLPHRLDRGGDRLSLFLPYDKDCFLRDDTITHIGVGDSFGRILFAPRRDVEIARRQYQKDFHVA